jgi:hypothetical protein
MFSSHNKSANIVFQPAYQHGRMGRSSKYREAESSSTNEDELAGANHASHQHIPLIQIIDPEQIYRSL